MYILFCCTNQKNVLQKEIKDWTFEVYLLTGEPSSWFGLTESLKMTCARSNAWFLDFLWNGQGLDCFSGTNDFPKLSKIITTNPKSVNINKQGQFWFAQRQQNDYQIWTVQSQQNNQFENLHIFSHGDARNIKFGHR